MDFIYYSYIFIYRMVRCHNNTRMVRKFEKKKLILFVGLAETTYFYLNILIDLITQCYWLQI